MRECDSLASKLVQAPGASVSPTRARAGLYQLLARLFQAPVDAVLLQAMYGTELMTQAPNKRVEAGVALLVGSLGTERPPADSRALAAFEEERLAAFSSDFDHIFSIHATRDDERISPFESVNFASDQDDVDDLRDDLVSTLDEEGVLLTPDWEGHRDHVSVELEMMGIYLQRMVPLLERSDVRGLSALLEHVRQFFGTHVVNWMPQLAHDVENRAQTTFYQGIAQMLDGIVAADAAILRCGATDESVVIGA